MLDDKGRVAALQHGGKRPHAATSASAHATDGKTDSCDTAMQPLSTLDSASCEQVRAQSRASPHSIAALRNTSLQARAATALHAALCTRASPSNLIMSDWILVAALYLS